MMDARLNIRLGRDSDGAMIHSLVQAGGFTIDGLDWTSVGPGWIVAEDADGLAGCIQVLPGFPVGRLELLATRPGMANIPKARAIHALVTQGCATLKRLGAGLAMGMVPHELKTYKRILKKRGAITVGAGAMLAKRLD